MQQVVWSAALALAVGAGLPALRAQQPPSPDSGQAALRPTEEITDFRGKGAFQVSVGDIQLVIGVEQAYRKERQHFLATELGGLRSSVFSDGEQERSFSPAQPVLIVKRYRNLNRVNAHPSLAVQMSMVTLGEALRSVEGLRVVGPAPEPVLGYPATIVEAPNRPLLQLLRQMGLSAGGGDDGLEAGKTRAWLTTAHGLPLKVDVFYEDERPAVVFGFTELKVNGELDESAFALGETKETPVVNVDVDLTRADWERRMEEELQQKIRVALGG